MVLTKVLMKLLTIKVWMQFHAVAKYFKILIINIIYTLFD